MGIKKMWLTPASGAQLGQVRRPGGLWIYAHALDMCFCSQSEYLCLNTEKDTNDPV